MEGTCNKYKRELYDSDENAAERLTFPKETKSEHIYDLERNQSHSKLFEDHNECEEDPSSETKDKFVPQESVGEIRGARRKALEKTLIKKASNELLREELLKTKATNELISEYRASFNLTNFVPSDFFSRDQTELSLKHPVYGTSSNAITLYSHGYKNKSVTV